MSKYRWQKDPP